jgi:citrate lyase subunit beta/citryl-CoA lyase
MPATNRPRRSLLYMPGSNTRALENGRKLPADGLILDLEDSVAPDAKQTARNNIREALAKGGYSRREVMVRINGFDTPWGEEDVAIAAKADAVLLPKVDNADAVRHAAALLDKAGAAPGVAVWCMMETPRGILSAQAIAEASPRMGGFLMGAEDLVKDLRAQHTKDRLPILTAIGLCVLAARANGLSIVDGVYTNLNDAEGLEFSCRQGLELGFDGKSVIHPKQIEPANRIFAPSEKELEWSRKIIAAHAEAAAKGSGVVLVDGKLVESLHVKNAQRLVDLAETCNALAADSAEASRG